MRVGILGYGNLGKYLVDFILTEGDKYNLQLDFVWNRNSDKLQNIQKDLILTKLDDIVTRTVDLIVEVAHPNVIQEHGVLFLSIANLFVGSPTALAVSEVEESLRKASKLNNHGLYIPSGAFWGAQDIQKMADIKTLSSLKVTMKKHPSAFRLQGDLKTANDEVLQNQNNSKPVTLYSGPVRALCPLAPNNVNTMAAAAIAAHNLGFDNVIGALVSDPGLLNWHIVEVEVSGVPTASGNAFAVKTKRKNPANPGVVTGTATYGSFRNSLLLAVNQPKSAGVHMC